MSQSRIATRYAKSLIDLAVERQSLEDVKNDMTLFLDAVSNRELLLLIKSPIIKSEKKIAIFKALFGNKMNEITSGFFDIVIRKNRESILPEMAAAFGAQYNKLKGITQAHLTSAATLTDIQLNAIKTKVKALGFNTQQVNFTKSIDPDIIGGFILRIGDQVYDASIRNKLDNVKKQVLENR